MDVHQQESAAEEEIYEEVDFVLPRRIKIILVTLSFITLLFLVSTIVLLVQNHRAGKSTAESDERAPQKVETLEEIMSAVSKLILLPEGEIPRFATVADPAQLTKQQFFMRAEIGDKVLMYTTSKRAILYSPKKNKIVEVGVVILGDDPNSFAPGVTSIPKKP